MREVLSSDELFDVTHKGVTDLVTEVDLWSEKEITSRIQAVFPEHTIIGEETSAQLVEDRGQTLAEIAAKGVSWIVDPIDGTTNFVNRIPHSVVSIGVLEDGVRTFGLVYDPYRDELFTARKGQGAFLNGKAISVSSKDKIIDAVVGSAFPHDNGDNWDYYRFVLDALIRDTRKVRILGAAALEQCWVACGRLDAFVEYSLKSWDVAAASLIIEEAGGVVREFMDNRDADFNVFSDSFYAAAAGIDAELYALVTKADDEGKANS
jgi:myo-inositol-1(or 4)-monophosphatase